MQLPFVEHIGAQILECANGSSLLALSVRPYHSNSQGIVHGGALFTLADTGMGAALHTTLNAGERCATIEIKITYFRPVLNGEILCRSEVVNRGRTVASLESTLTLEGAKVGKASGTFAIFRPKEQSAT